MVNLEQEILREENERKPNRYVADAMLCTFLIVILFEIVNELGFFNIEDTRLRWTAMASGLVMLVTRVLGRSPKRSADPASKYWMMACILVEILMIMGALEQWALLSLMIPLLLAALYHDRKILWFSLLGTGIIAIISNPIATALHAGRVRQYLFQAESCGIRILGWEPVESFDYAYYIPAVFKYVSLPRALVLIGVSIMLFSVVEAGTANLQERIRADISSRVDILTGIYNRFSFHKKLEEYEQDPPQQLICVYADADGLHELNDRMGHAAGDRMLKTCAEAMSEVFGENCYRIGGDEFLAFAETADLNAVREQVSQVRRIVEQAGYHMSLGYARKLPETGLEDLTRLAETEMYAAKSAWYRSSGRDRRRKSTAGGLTDSPRRQILIVEDNAMNREILAGILSGSYDTIEAENGQAGLEILQKQYANISLIIADMQMPVMNGHEFLRALQQDPALEKIPVIVATGSSDPDSEAACLDEGASDYVTKPYNRTVILSRISSLIRLRESAQALSAVEFDELTGLYTRQAFYHHAGQILKQNPETRYDLLLSDLDDFRIINERYGEETGDRILRYIADYLTRGKPEGVLIGRYGGDQFVSLMPHTDGLNEAFLEKIYRDLTAHAPLAGINGKFGVYDDVDHRLPVSVLCDRALMALRTVKHQYGRLFARYEEAMQEKKERTVRIERSMKTALEQKQFVVYYQPKHDAVSGRLVGAEALIRWIHPEYGFISPGEFIPIFEKNGFVVEADRYVLRRTCENLRRWADEGLQVVPVSVNESILDLNTPDFLKHISDTLKEFDVPAKEIHLEVTESLFIDNVEHVTEVLQETGLCRGAGRFRDRLFLLKYPGLFAAGCGQTGYVLYEADP